jgi:Na+/H+ antiporter NhaD/arsenite permease-like protein
MVDLIELTLNAKILSIIIFLATYIYIATGRREHHIASMGGAALLWMVGVMSGEEMFRFIDFDTLGLLFGMMVIVGALKESGFFRYIGLKIAEFCKYVPLKMFITLTLAMALLSALLANVTVVLFMTIIIIELAETFEFNPKPFIFGMIMASNIGGAATLIGDPPNIIIASEINLQFLDFIYNTAGISIVTLFIVLLLFYYIYRKELGEGRIVGEPPFKARELIVDQKLLYISMATFMAAIIFFFLQQFLNLSVSAIAMVAATFLLFMGGDKMPKVLEDVEWDTLIFLAGLFIVIGGLEKTGVIHDIAVTIKPIMGENIFVSLTIVVWISSIFSAFIDNIPFTVAFIPILEDILSSTSFPQSSLLWWALVLGVDYGGNGTPIASSANIVAIHLAKDRGYDISFKEFMKIGFITLFSSVGIANIYLILRAYFNI